MGYVDVNWTGNKSARWTAHVGILELSQAYERYELLHVLFDPMLA